MPCERTARGDKLGSMRTLLIGLGVVIAACDNTPSNYAGDYTASVTNETGGTCGLPSWVDGQVTANLDIAVTQDPTDIAFGEVTFGGAEADYLDSLMGTHSVSGYVRGDGFFGQMFGSIPLSGGPCAQATTVYANVTFVLDSDGTAHGAISYGRSGTAGCDCASDQTFDAKKN